MGKEDEDVVEDDVVAVDDEVEEELARRWEVQEKVEKLVEKQVEEQFEHLEERLLTDIAPSCSMAASNRQNRD